MRTKVDLVCAVYRELVGCTEPLATGKELAEAINLKLAGCGLMARLKIEESLQFGTQHARLVIDAPFESRTGSEMVLGRTYLEMDALRVEKTGKDFFFFFVTEPDEGMNPVRVNACREIIAMTRSLAQERLAA